jgi:endonuclease/exonuclease/phosphatase family metal-dependent hydrolase
VTRNILESLLAQPFIQERYYVSDTDARTFYGWYGVVLLIDIRLHISHLNLINFPQSTMGRRLVLAEIKLDKDEVLRIGTVHLESLNSKPQRLCQLDICQKEFNRSPGTCILMGDFNFHARGQENIDQFNALPGWMDVWVNVMGTNNPGFTFDTETNLMTKHNKEGGADTSRYDRIILRSQTIIPTQIEILGNESVGKQGHISIFPSDHFGLTAVFEKKK